MLFTSPEFAVFLAAVLALFYAFPKPARRYLLLAASLAFYMAWKAQFVVLLLGLITVDYFAARWIVHKEGRSRRTALLVSLGANLGLLGYFKYTNFLYWNLHTLLNPGQPFHALDIILPLGISFHTFQSISYVIDVYRGEQPAITSFVDYALFVSFFPQLVAGPIVRAREFFLDYFNWRPPTGAEWQRGFALILTGFVKKLVCADQFAIAANRYFDNPRDFHGFLPAWTGAIAFALQIFFDFSGYTDIAIGVALLFGFHFPENFRRPYLSASVTEFWRRWHITLSGWLRDYVYISLGGNRRGRVRTYANLLATMLLGGLWHGASWNFVIWGGYHGLALAIERRLEGREARRGIIRIPLAILTFAIVCVGWVFFRAPTLNASLFTIGQMFAPREVGVFMMTGVQMQLAVATLVIALAEEHAGILTALSHSPAWARTAAAVLALLGIVLFSASDRSLPFVYFQF